MMRHYEIPGVTRGLSEAAGTGVMLVNEDEPIDGGEVRVSLRRVEAAPARPKPAGTWWIGFSILLGSSLISFLLGMAVMALKHRGH